MRFWITIFQGSSDYKKRPFSNKKTTIDRSNMRLNLSLRMLVKLLRHYSSLVKVKDFYAQTQNVKTWNNDVCRKSQVFFPTFAFLDGYLISFDCWNVAEHMTSSKLCGDTGKLCGCSSYLAEWFFTQPTRSTRNFFPKSDITDLNAPVFKEWLFQLCL